MRTAWSYFVLLLSSVLLLSCSPAFGQVATGTPPFSSSGGGPDVIDLANLNAHLTVPVLNKAGRGIPFNYNLTYDSSVWYPVTSGSTMSWQPASNFGWGVVTNIPIGYVTEKVISSHFCYHGIDPEGQYILTGDFAYHDAFGVSHPFSGTYTYESGTCGSEIIPLNSTTYDGSGYTISVGNGPETVTARNGKIVSLGGNTITDANGNQISFSTAGVFTDTLGQAALTVSQNAPGPSTPTTFTYVAPSGANAAYTMNYTSYTVATNFGVSGIGEYGATAQSLVSSIVLPDHTQYTFTYEATPATPSTGACTPLSGTYSSNCITARIKSVQLPTGGTISYGYTGGNNGILADGTAATLTRTTPDGAWTYSRVLNTAPASTTTITDPQSNQTVLNFQGIYETEKQVYQGSASGTPLKTTFTCYNTAAPNCNATAITLPITQRSHFVQWPGGMESETATTYNAYGLVTEKDEYAYGPSAPGSIVRKTLTAYATLGNGIFSQPYTITVEDGSGNIKSQTTYTYDQGTVTATSGTPQQVAVSGSRGNATTVNFLVGSTSLNKTYTFYDTGTVQTATDVNGAITTLNYSSGSCGNSFPTSVSEPMSLSRSMTWNCTGGVGTSVTDENSKTSNFAYTSDPDFWRPNSATDPGSNVADFTYTGGVSSEGSVVFNSSASTADALNTLDSSGRMHIAQVKESPTSSTYDSVETDYDMLGRLSRVTVPYPATAGTLNSTAPAISTTYDALGRKTQVSQTGGRITTYSYTQNDTDRTLSPAPTGENTKRKQFEYDAQGRLTSVCEISTVLPNTGTCGQSTTATGYWTQYTYDPLNNLVSVTQNAQSTGSKQTRTYAHDDLGRMTSETNPESAITTYTYDSDTTCGTSHGDMVKKVDAVGNTTCFTYDARHRQTSATYSGPYSGNTPSKYFTYDSATVNGVAMANVKARMAEAYTCVSPCSSKITDIGLSYTVLDQVSDVYESTTHSGGYYHVTSTYFANGAVNTLSNLVGLPAITYNVDGEGRIYSASAASGQNPLNSTAYNTTGSPTTIALGSSDSDSFTYDPNTNRTTQYKFNVNGQSVVGTLTWNAIGTLETLAITDPFYGAGNQTCTYGHDDIKRIASVSCGSPWSQTFTYDAFSNLSKSGTISFQPTYSYLTNHMTAIGSSSPTYDANGNVLTDTAHTYAWDANGKAVTVDTVGVTYDAFGRMVEQNKAGVFTQITYSPTGGKLAIMQGQALQKAFVPLSGGSVAVFNSTGLVYYRHPDWLGSSRFASTPARALYFDGAYAPFGENYSQTGTSDLSFTGMNQDTVSNLFDFPMREYNPIHGRWPSPDPAGIASVRMTDPQTLNRYAYARNSPLQLRDLTGMDAAPACPTSDPDSDDDSGSCDSTVDNGSGGASDDGDDDDDSDQNGNDSNSCSQPNLVCQDQPCDTACQAQNLVDELTQALNAVNNPVCGNALDGGTGAVAATISANLAVPGGNSTDAFSLGPITSATLDPTSGAVTSNNGPNFSSIWMNSSQIQLNNNPSACCISGVPSSIILVVSLLHDTGHQAGFAGIPNSIVPNDNVPPPYQPSDTNNHTTADACFPDTDGGQGNGTVDYGDSPVDAARKKLRRH